MTEENVNVEVEAQPAQAPVASNPVRTHLNRFKSSTKNWDWFLVGECFYLFMTWLFLVAQKDSQVRHSAQGFAWYVSMIFLIDLMFRLLSYRVECINPKQWNHLWLCLFPVVFFMLAAFYGFDDAVYDSAPLQVWNALFFTCYFVGAIVCAVYRCVFC